MPRPRRPLVAGGYVEAGRVVDARREFGLTIENRCRRIREADGRTWTLSEYRLTDAPPT